MLGMKKVLLRIPDDLAGKIDERAAKVNLSRNEWLTRALEWATEQPVTVRTIKQKV